MYKRVLGTKDILPEEVQKWQELENTSRQVFSLYNYQEIRTPIIEEATLFQRSLGDSAEIVQKQMFLIKREEDAYVLRPEGTASIVRAYIENNLDKTIGFVKLYYLGAMFRAERPQKGRLRQFNHIGCEVIGSYAPEVDVEVISMADRLLESFLVKDYQIKVNSLGCVKDKSGFAEQLRCQLKAKLKELCADCQIRFKQNALRILDCKNEACKQVITKLDIHDNSLCPDCIEHFNKVKVGLDLLKIKYEVTPTLVRGLDYYTRTVFEITHSDLGAQDALGAGGRYDNLVADLGGPKLGAVGFALGVERLLLVRSQEVPACRQAGEVRSQKLVYVIPLGEGAGKYSLRVLDELRQENIPSSTDYENKSLKGAMRKANDLGARYVVIIGEDELKKGIVTLKDMISGEQKEVKQEDLIKELQC